MENQPVTNTPNVSSATPLPNQVSVSSPVKVNLLLPILFSTLVRAIICGAGGYYLGKQSTSSSQPAINTQVEATPISSITTPTTPPAGVKISGWKNYSVSSLNLTFQYPPNLVVVTDINNSTVLAADKEYWVAIDGTDVMYLDMFLYSSTKDPSDWWDTEGKDKFQKLADEIGNVMSPKAIVNLTYNVQPTTFVGNQALNVTVSSNYESPHTPKQRYLTILQQNGYIVMLSYNDQGTTEPSIDISKQILSTFQFANEENF